MRPESLGLPDSLRRVLNAVGAWRASNAECPDDAATLRTEVIQAADRSARYLHSQIRRDGGFAYRINAFSGREDVRRYNVLRHAGSVLALVQHARASGLAKGDAERLSCSARFLIDHCIRAPQARHSLLAVWSDPKLTGGRRRRPVAKLGGTGLVLAALLELETLRKETADTALATTVLPMDGLRALGRFLLFMQRPDGSFQSLFSDVHSPGEDAWASLYYPGEAALGLIMLYEHDRDSCWLRSAVRALNYLAISRDGRPAPPDHWALIATDRLFECAEEALQSSMPESVCWRSDAGRVGVRDLLVRHAEAVVATMLDEQCLASEGDCPAGWFGPAPRTAPTATRLEGLLAASKLPLDVHLMARLPAAVASGLRFLLDSQLQSGPAAGGFTRTSLRCARKDDRRATEVRIDYVQHALAAFGLYAGKRP